MCLLSMWHLLSSPRIEKIAYFRFNSTIYYDLTFAVAITSLACKSTVHSNLSKVPFSYKLRSNGTFCNSNFHMDKIFVLCLYKHRFSIQSNTSIYICFETKIDSLHVFGLSATFRLLAQFKIGIRKHFYIAFYAEFIYYYFSKL